MSAADKVRSTSLVVRNFDRLDANGDAVMGADGLGEDCWYVVVKEAYTGSTATGFHTERLTLDVHNEEGDVNVEIDVAPMELLDLGAALIDAARKMLEQQRGSTR